MSNVITALQERGFIDNLTDSQLAEISEKPLKVYCGFDPTSGSLHLGNFIAIMGLAHFQRFGHTPVALLGGATALVGDPSGKSKERPLLSTEIIAKNTAGIQSNLEQVLNFQSAQACAEVVNNYDWFSQFSLIEFLRDIGKNFRMGPMLSKDSVKTRLQSSEGLSFTEFSYQVLQGYDFYHLFSKHGVAVQLGGSDQWGNITAGTELVRKLTGKTAYGITFPLLTTSDGRKFGKSEGGAIWLSPEKLSPYDFYQYLYRTPDADVIKLMKLLTFMELQEIQTIEEGMKKGEFASNEVQKRLAEEVTRIVHGKKGVEEALKTTQQAAPGAKTELTLENLKSLEKQIPLHDFPSKEVLLQKLMHILHACGLCKSRGEARRLIKNGGVYCNNKKVLDENFVVDSELLIEQTYLLLALGKKRKVLVRIVDS